MFWPFALCIFRDLFRWFYFTIYTLLCGAANGLTNLLVLTIIAFAAVSVFFPMISAGQLLASLIFAAFLYREKLSRRMYPAAALGLASLVLLNI